MTSQALTLAPPLELEEAPDAEFGHELSDADLACVVGGLARIWVAPDPNLADEEGRVS